MLDQKEINPFSVALVMWGPEYQILGRKGLQRRRDKTWLCLDSIPGRRRWFYRKTVATIRSTMCPHLNHNAFTFSPLRTTEAFPCSEFQAEHFQALKNISQVVCFVRHRYQGSLQAWFEWSKTEDVSSIGKPDCVTHILYYLRTNRNLEIISGPMRSELVGVKPHTLESDQWEGWEVSLLTPLHQ